MRNSTRLKADLLLLLVTFFWGSAFVAMRLAAGHHTIFLLNGARFLLGGFPFTNFRGAYTRHNLLYVGLAGLALYIGAAFQQAGLASTTAGNGGFITSLYVVIVPIILWVGVARTLVLADAAGCDHGHAGRFSAQHVRHFQG